MGDGLGCAIPQVPALLETSAQEDTGSESDEDGSSEGSGSDADGQDQAVPRSPAAGVELDKKVSEHLESPHVKVAVCSGSRVGSPHCSQGREVTAHVLLSSESKTGSC